MAKKKLLSEAQVRRFMGLAGMQASTVSNHINEMGTMMQREEDPDPADDEMGGDMPPAPMGDEDPVGEPEGMEGDVDLDPDAIMKAMADIEDLKAFLQPLADAAGGEKMDDEPEMGGDMEEPEMGGDMEEPEMEMEEGQRGKKDDEEQREGMRGKAKKDDENKKMMDEELAEVNLELNEEEIVQEVARRVAQRIIKAKRAQKELNEALGKK